LRNVGVTGKVTVENGPVRALPGVYSITFTPPDPQPIGAFTGVEITTRDDGSKTAQIFVDPGFYTLSVEYEARTPADLALLREPQRDSLGLNGDGLIAFALDIFQRDLADQLTVSTAPRSVNIQVTAGSSGIQVDVVASVAVSTQAQIDLTFDIGDEFTLDLNGQVKFDTARLGDTAQKIADALKGAVTGGVASVVAGALTVFSLSSNIAQGNVLKAGANNKVTLSFKPCFLKDFSVAATLLP
jgi:hypothetical protein